MCLVGRTASRKRMFVRSSSQPTTSNTSIRIRPTKLRSCPPGCPDTLSRGTQHTERGSSVSLPLHDDRSSAPAPVVPDNHSTPSLLQSQARVSQESKSRDRKGRSSTSNPLSPKTAPQTRIRSQVRTLRVTGTEMPLSFSLTLGRHLLEP